MDWTLGFQALTCMLGMQVVGIRWWFIFKEGPAERVPGRLIPVSFLCRVSTRPSLERSTLIQ